MKLTAEFIVPRHLTFWLLMVLLLSMVVLPAPSPAQAQQVPPVSHQFMTGPSSDDPQQIALQYLHSHVYEFGLTPDDLGELRLVDRYTTAHNGVTHLVFRQQLDGIDVFQGDIAVNVARDGSIINIHNAAISQIAKKIKTQKPRLSALAVLMQTASALGLSSSASPGVLPQPVPTQSRAPEGVQQATEFLAPAYSADPIPMKLIYQPLDDGTVVLAWNMILRFPDGSQWLDVRADANTGSLVSQVSWSSDSSAQNSTPQTQSASIARSSVQADLPVTTNSSIDGSSYLVYPFDVERPDLGTRVTITNPADPIASPYGWHDTNGVAGAEYTTTRGNNAFAYADISVPNGFNTGDVTVDGGPSLTFAPPLNLSQLPSTYREASVTQVFYTTNMLHDTLYHYGFDEASGNFQQTNYSGNGLGGDAVNAETQDYSGTDNANFNTPPDGMTPTMQVYLGSGSGKVRVNSPSSIEGLYYGGTSILYLATPYSVTANVILAVDNAAPTSDACSTLTNAAQVAGKIVLVDRGNCDFAVKVANANTAGAVGVVIANNVGTTQVLNIGGAPVQPIPSIGISYNDGQTLRNALTAQTVNLTMSMQPNDIAFDTGVVMHEYGHGLSNRLTGGPADSGCLSSLESRGMGEGWSDILAIMLLAKASDTRTTPKPIGTWLQDQPSTGAGIRTYPYSSDTSINPRTYGDLLTISTGIPHTIGEVWATILWEVYWDLVEVYGFDPDKAQGTGGNNLFLQLMIDGMKLQKCNPSFVDARDAILLADQINNAGANQCLLWAAFARRGLGFEAQGKDSLLLSDTVESFDAPPTCTLSITPTELDVCLPNNTAINASIGLGELISGSTTLSASGIPGASATFTPNPVTAPNTSVLNLSLNPGMAAGAYTLTVSESSGESAKAQVYVANATPTAPSLSTPSDNASNQSFNPLFTWNAGTQTYSYTLEIAADSSFNQIVLRESLRDTSYQLTSALNSQQTYYWRVIGTNACGSDTSATSQFTVRTIPAVLLVDDDKNSPDVRSVYTNLLNQLGIGYDLWDTGNGGDLEPNYSQMYNYQAVVWFGGPDSYGAIEATTEDELAQYLDDNKCLIISAQDYFARKGLTPFMQNYLGLAAAVDDPGQTTVTGAGPFAGFGPYVLNYSAYSNTNYSDGYTPAADAGIAFNGNAGAASVYKSSNYRTILFGFAIEGLPSAARQPVLERALSWCLQSQLNASAETLTSSYLPGQPFSYTATLTNTSALATKNITLTLSAPSFVSNLQLSSNQAISAGASANTWHIASMAANLTQTITIEGQIDPSLNTDTNGTISLALDSSSLLNDQISAPLQTAIAAEVPKMSFSSASSSAAESAGDIQLSVELDRTNPYAPSNATLSISAGSATLGSDFTLASTAISIPAGSNDTNITVSLIDDTEIESTETVEFTLTSLSGAQLGSQASHTLTINSDDVVIPEANLQVSAPALSSNLLPGQPFTYTITLTNTGASDASAVSAELVLPSFAHNVQVTSDGPLSAGASANEWILGDIAVNGTRTLTIQGVISPSISSDLNGTISASFATTALETELSNNVVQTSITAKVPRISFASATASVSEAAGQLTLVVKLDQVNPYSDTSVAVNVSAATATLGSDFTMPSSLVVIPAGALSANLTITILNDTQQEPNETITLALSSPSGAQLANPSTSIITITDDDIPNPDTTNKVYLPFIRR